MSSDENDDANSRRQPELAARSERAAERIYEDEGLTGDLSDEPARALIDWAVAQVSAVAGDPSADDARVSAFGSAVRAAVRAAARSGESDPQRLLALAAGQLAAGGTGPVLQSAAALAQAMAPAPEQPCGAARSQEQAPSAPDEGPVSRWAERWRRWLRKAF